MLHLIPDSSHRDELLKVVALQEQLIEALCALPANQQVQMGWLTSVWKHTCPIWIDRFWNNEKGRRAAWINVISAAPNVTKARIIAMWRQQLEFAKLYDQSLAFRLEPCDRTDPVMDAVGDLLTDFYAPLLYGEGITVANQGPKVSKDLFIGGFQPEIKVCLYTDYPIPKGAAKLDHFLPKERFPALSCHPDNLFPCSTDANNGGRKGPIPPLEIDAQTQAARWFHPRLRSAHEKFKLHVSQTLSRQPELTFVAHDPEDQPRLDKLNDMFHLTESWALHLDDRITELGNTVSGNLKLDNEEPTFDKVRSEVVKLAGQKTRERKSGRYALAICESYFYQHVANSRYLLNDILRICVHGT